MGVYLHTKLQGSSIIIMSFRKEVILPPPSSPQNEPLKNPPRLGLIIGDSGPGKTSPLLNLIKQEDDDGYSIID